MVGNVEGEASLFCADFLARACGTRLYSRRTASLTEPASGFGPAGYNPSRNCSLRFALRERPAVTLGPALKRSCGCVASRASHRRPFDGASRCASLRSLQPNPQRARLKPQTVAGLCLTV